MRKGLRSLQPLEGGFVSILPPSTHASDAGSPLVGPKHEFCYAPARAAGR